MRGGVVIRITQRGTALPAFATILHWYAEIE
jgi:hypothetical protein